MGLNKVGNRMMKIKREYLREHWAENWSGNWSAKRSETGWKTRQNTGWQIDQKQSIPRIENRTGKALKKAGNWIRNRMITKKAGNWKENL